MPEHVLDECPGPFTDGTTLCETLTVDRLRLAKYEALGNDFLIVLDQSAGDALDHELIVALCDRHRGIGRTDSSSCA